MEIETIRVRLVWWKIGRIEKDEKKRDWRNGSIRCNEEPLTLRGDS